MSGNQTNNLSFLPIPNPNPTSTPIPNPRHNHNPNHNANPIGTHYHINGMYTVLAVRFRKKHSAYRHRVPPADGQRIV